MVYKTKKSVNKVALLKKIEGSNIEKTVKKVVNEIERIMSIIERGFF